MNNAQIAARRRHVALLGEKHALALLDIADAERRELVMESLRRLTHERDVLDQQAAWINRRTGWAVPSAPAWTD